MSRLEFNNGCSLDIHPIFDNVEKWDEGTQFIECATEESILGEIPKIILIVKTTHNLCELGEEIEGRILDDKGNPIYFVGYVISISFINDKCVIVILCTRPDFVREEVQNTYSGMGNAIRGLYPGRTENIIFRDGSKSNLMDDMKIYQEDKTNHDMLTQLLLGYKKNTIFGFALGKLLINTVNPFTPLDVEVSSLIEFQPINAPRLTNPMLYSKEAKIIDYSKGKDPNHKIVKFFSKYISVDKEYENFVANFTHNSRFLQSVKSSANYSTRVLLPINITDSIKFYNEAVFIKDCFISKREIKFSNQNMEVFYTIQSINPV